MTEIENRLVLIELTVSPLEQNTASKLVPDTQSMFSTYFLKEGINKILSKDDASDR